MIKKFNVEKTKQMNKIDWILSVFYKKPIFHAVLDFNSVENILIVDFALIGDMIMNIPFLKNIKFNCPHAKITMVCMPWAEAVLGNQNLVDEFVVFDGKNKLSGPKQIAKNWREIKKIIDKINEKVYQIGFEPKGDLRHTLFMHYTKCQRTITYNYTGGSYLVTDSFIPLPETMHLIDEKLDLLRLSGFEIREELSVPKLTLSKEMVSFNKKFREENNLIGRTIIGLHPGASNLNKQYQYYPELVEKLINEYGSKIVFCFFEGNGEKEIVDQVCAKVEKSQFVRVKKNLKEYISLVSICDYMICNDSAAGHIAAAYGISTLVIFGPVKAETAAPRGTGRIVTISKNYECKPCTLPICPLGTNACIKSTNVDEVFCSAKELIVLD